MKKIEYLLFILLVFFTVNVNAANKCDSKEFSRLKELARKVEFDYDYKIDGNEVDFIINATNLNSDLKVLIIENYYAGKYREFKGTDTGSLNGFNSGEKVVITIKGFVPNECSGVTVLTRTLKLPYYNWFYDEEQCKGNESFKYCKLLIDKNITRGDFEKQLAKYIENEAKKKEEQEKPIEEESSTNYKDLFILIGFGLVVAAIISALIAMFIKRRKKNQL